MAGFTIASDTRVNVLCILEWRRAGVNGSGRVADETVLVCRQVIKCFACTDNTVMTRRAVTRDSSMIKYCAAESTGIMTETTIFIGCNMID